MKFKSKNIQVLTAAILWITGVSAQTITTASLGFVNRSTPKFGFNTTAHVPAKPASGIIGANWTQQWFIDSVATLNAEILRFPGGTNANHWDWKTGWFRPGYQPAGSTLMIRADEFKSGKEAAQAEGLYVVNLETSTPAYEMQGVRYADSLGLNFKLYELGNEHNLYDPANLNQAMTSVAYAQLAKPHFDSIMAFNPSAKICVVGGNTGANGTNPNPAWNNDIINIIPNIHAFAFHVYLTANNADMAFNVNRALAIPYANSNTNTGLSYRYANAGFSALPSGKETWVTEFNLDELQLASSYVISQTWTHVLYNTGMMDFFLAQDNITMILNHTLAAAADHYESISKKDKSITANGISMKLICDVAKGSQSCQNIVFSGNHTMSSGMENIPKIIGWKFMHTGVEKGFLCNYSPDTFKVSLAGVFSNPMTFDQYFADIALTVMGLSSLNKYSGNSSDSITLYPFSITQVTSSLTTSIEKLSESNSLWVFPNPAQDMVNIQFSDELKNATLSIFDITGKELKRVENIIGNKIQLFTAEFSQGLYLFTIKNGEQIMTGNFMVD